MPRALTLVFVILAATVVCAGQQASAPTGDVHQLVMPAGTRIALVLLHPVQSRSIRRGDTVYAQVTSPVTAGEQVLIPAGTAVEGTLDRMGRKGLRGELHLQSLLFVLANGYVVPVNKPQDITSAEGYAQREATSGRMVASFILPEAGAGLGALIGHSVAGPTTTDAHGLPTNSRLKSTAIGTTVGLAAGSVGSFILLAGSRRFSLDAGSPLEMTLAEPLVLDAQRVADALAHARTQPVQKVNPLPKVIAPSVETKSPWDCPLGEEWCGGSCVSTATYMTDTANCGRCGNSCAIGESCTGGSCRKFPEPIQ